jgi:MFS family permease
MDSPIKPFNNVDNNHESIMVKESLITIKPYRQVKYLVFIVSLLCLSPFYYGYTLTYISTITPAMLETYYGLDAAKPVMIGVIIGIVPIGACFGALLAPNFMKFLSRKNFILFFNVIALMIAGIIQINYLSLLLVCRFIQGFIVGNYMGVVPIYIK